MLPGKWSAALGASLLALTLLGCALKQPPPQATLVADALPDTTVVPLEWTTPADDTGEVDDGWIGNFGDEDLEALVAEALDLQAPNMRLAASRVDRAAGLSRLAGSKLKPTVGLGANLSSTSVGPAASRGNAVGLSGSWELDVWGRVRAGAAAADENLRAVTADFEFARQSVAAATAKSWFLVTELQLQEQLAEELVRLLGELVRLVQDKQEVGQVTLREVYLARADLFSAEDALRQVRSGRQQAARGLEVLVGRYPSAELEAAEDLAVMPPPIPAGTPSGILSRRPDLQAAERRVAAAFFQSESARLARLPSFNLSGVLGQTSAIDNSIAQLGLGLVAPLYAGGAIAGQIDTANADQQAAIAAYGLSLLRAFEEVEGALTDEDLLEQRERFVRAAVEDYGRAYELAQIQYEVGRADLLSVLQQQLRWVGSRVTLLNVRDARLQRRVDLHLALGGSFAASDEVDSGP